MNNHNNIELKKKKKNIETGKVNHWNSGLSLGKKLQHVISECERNSPYNSFDIECVKSMT